MNYSVNLLPASEQRAALLRRRARQWLAVWMVAIVLAIPAVCGRVFLIDNRDLARQDAVQRQTERLENAEKRLTVAQARLVVLRDKEATLQNPADDVSGILVLGVISKCTRLAEGAVQVEGLSIARTSGATSASAESKAPRRNPRLLTLKGIASDGIAAAAFATNLRDAGVFTSVERKPSGNAKGDDQRPLAYQIECTF